mmetsp:Transcript_52596/g.60166  ORF Transcript_52596/g.60166 Transcript_52596/m.60166 type:complete len:175 (-) Transcript_52596:126-650(-)
MEGTTNNAAEFIPDVTSYGIIAFTRCTKSTDTPRFVLVQHLSGFIDFPKGRPEKTDSSERASGIREFTEETGLTDVDLQFIHDDDQVIVTEYIYRRKLKGGVKKKINKRVVYWVAMMRKDVTVDDMKVQTSEIRNGYMLSYDEATTRITYDQTKNLLDQAQTRIKIFLGTLPES